ncbi:DUF4326 domain-containing protein [Kribbella sp. NPDC058693]|uniref:DUF4326 domain-containing protein n=1 Tax=Kribbella sp. NPDC058693 TaxID=3346602 RepID=UPI003649866E
MIRPEGLQKQRRRGSRLPVGTIVVDRSSRRGNPFTVEQILLSGEAADEPEARALAVRRYADWLDGHGPRHLPVTKTRTVDRDWINANMHELVGRDLACTCPVDGLPCHRDVLLARAALLERTSAGGQLSVQPGMVATEGGGDRP